MVVMRKKLIIRAVLLADRSNGTGDPSSAPELLRADWVVGIMAPLGAVNAVLHIIPSNQFE